jgi:hypothetical protein
MDAPIDDQRWFNPAFIILPSIYVGLIVLTYALSVGTRGGAYYRIWGVDPLAAMFGMVYDSEAIIIAVFLITGTPWWYLVGRIGWSSKQRLSTALGGALFALFTCFVTSLMTLEIVKQDIQGGLLTGRVIFQYSLVASLCFGALVTALALAIRLLLKYRHFTH